LLSAQQNQEIVSITGGAVPAIYFRDQRISLERLGPLLDQAKRDNHSIIIKADRQTPYELVVAVTNAALQHGISSVSLAGSAPK
jgi:biopolymer transport protein ExbD